MKVAVVFNEPYTQLFDPYASKCSEQFKLSEAYKMRGNDIIAEYELISECLRKKGFEAYNLNILDDFNILLTDLEKNKPDIIFNLVEIYKDRAGLEKNFASFFKLLNIPFTGGTTKNLGICQNKYLSKQILAANGISVPKFKCISRIEENCEIDINYPAIVKPVSEDGSIGIDDDSVVRNYDKAIEKINFILNNFKQPAIIEEFIDGRELNVSIIESDDLIVLPISEIDFSDMPENFNKIVGFNAKWNSEHQCYKKTIPICPAKLTKEIEKKVKETAINCFKLLQCSGYARVDIRLNESGEIFVLELNPNPDLSLDAGFFRAAKMYGYSYSDVLEIIVKNALNRT